MRRTWGLLFLLALSATVTVQAQTESPVLVTVELSRPSASTFVDRLHTRVYYATESWALIELSPAQVELARRAGHAVTVIDSKLDPDSYRLVTVKRGRVSRADLAGADVLLERDGIVITRGNPTLDAGRSTQGLKSVPLRPLHIALDNGAVVGTPSFPASTDSLIASIVARINPDTVRWFIQHLQDFKTRHANAANRDTVAEWIKAQFERMGYATAGRDSFSRGGVWQTNVTATLPGIGTSGEIIVFGGHHDSNSGSPYTAAPGADDNASGTAAALETARVLKEAGYTPKVTIKFATFAAEEVGLVGSAVDAARSVEAGTKIRLMINHDMIANNPGTHVGSPVRVYYYTGSESWRELAKQSTNQFTTLVGLNGGANSGGSDSYSYWAYGYPAVYFFEDQFSPVYHTPADTIGNINIDYCAEVIRASAATLLRAAAIPSEVRGLDIADRGDGSSLCAWWMPGTDGPAAAYRVSVGASSGAYDSSFTVSDTAATIGGLVAGTLYYVAVAAVDADGNISLLREKSGTPRTLPLTPGSFSTTPGTSTLSLQWRANRELDFLGYNIYRSETSGEEGTLLNAVPYTDTTYADVTVQKHAYYYYTVRAMDSLFNESPPTAQLRSRLVSLDMGILLVDESADSHRGSGKSHGAGGGRLLQLAAGRLYGHAVRRQGRRVRRAGRHGGIFDCRLVQRRPHRHRRPVRSSERRAEVHRARRKVLLCGIPSDARVHGEQHGPNDVRSGRLHVGRHGHSLERYQGFFSVQRSRSHCRLLSGRHGGFIDGWAGERVPSPLRRSDIPCHGQPGGLRIRLRVRHKQPVWQLEGAACRG